MLKDGLFHPFLIPRVIAVFLSAGGLYAASEGLIGRGAIAQIVNRDPVTGAVTVDRNAFQLQTTDLGNDSGIGLPTDLPESVGEKIVIPVEPERQAPNGIILRIDQQYIEDNFSVPNSTATYTLDGDSIRANAFFELDTQEGSHRFAEGLEVIIRDSQNNEIGVPLVEFVRGSFDELDVLRVQDANGNIINLSDVEVIRTESFGPNDSVQVRVLHIESDGAPLSAASESGVYFTRDGQLIAEDSDDNDFDDGNYLNSVTGEGSADAVASVSSRESANLEETQELEPELRTEETVLEQETVTTTEVASDVISEERVRGSIETPDPNAMRLGHAVGVRTENDEQLVYNRYGGTVQLRAGSDGLSAAAQLPPLIGNPNVPPTLLTGELNFNPWVSDNEAGLSATVAVTQFLTRTHHIATDAFGNTIENPAPRGSRLVEPTGLFNNRRLVGYVPAVVGVDADDAQLSSQAGIFNLPADQAVVIKPLGAGQVGAGDAAYERNVGGYIIERTDGSMTFVPQWTEAGYAQDDITLAAGEAARIIYALVPQQAGQNLQVDQRYEVTTGPSGYQIVDGGFRIISADRQPQNFLREMAEVYAVEDTVQGSNAATPEFNGVQGTYITNGQLMPTVDINLPNAADARVGNEVSLLTAANPQPGQAAYARTTRAAGFYLGGSFTGGIGNQRDTIQQRLATSTIETDQQRTTLAVNQFLTPLTQVSFIRRDRLTTTDTPGTARFDISAAGELENTRFESTDEQLAAATTNVSFDVLSTETEITAGEEEQIESTTNTQVEVLARREVASDETAVSGSDSYANASPVQGEIALGGVLNFGNTPWTPAANTVRAELFFRDTVIGRGGSGSETGWRASLMFHPFGERQREAYQYDEFGNVVPLYKTEAVRDANGVQVMEEVVAADGSRVMLPVNRFVIDELTGDRIPQTVGTGRSQGPGLYVRAQDTWDDDDSLAVDGGVQLSF